MNQTEKFALKKQLPSSR